MTPKSILIVDDVVVNIEILIEILGDTYDIRVALDGKSALEIAQQEHLDLILLDILMPEMDGYSVCEELKADTITKEIPVIFTTAVSDEAAIERAYEVGGIDYVNKPFKPKELKARIKRELQMQELIHNLARSQEALQQLAFTDSMTGLYNRRYFSQVAENLLKLARRNREKISMILLDIDFFKKVNDTYGHDVGDEVIIAVSANLQHLLRSSDIICRWGGEEFLVLLPQADLSNTTTIAEKIRQEIASHVVVNEKVSLSVCVSLGVTSVDLNQEDAIKSAISRADEALYDAKRSGRNRVCTLAHL